MRDGAMGDPAEIAGLIADGRRLAAHVVGVLSRRIEAGEQLEWIKDQAQSDSARLADVGVYVHSYFTYSGDATIRVWCLDGSRATDADLRTRLSGMERFRLEIIRDGEMLGSVASQDPASAVGQLVTAVVRSAEVRRREMRREFLNGLGE